MAAVCRTSLSLSSGSPLNRHGNNMAFQLNLLRNILYRSYSNVGKTAAFMMRSTKRGKDKLAYWTNLEAAV